jgi:hypothetical protein
MANINDQAEQALIVSSLAEVAGDLPVTLTGTNQRARYCLKQAELSIAKLVEAAQQHDTPRADAAQESSRFWTDYAHIVLQERKAAKARQAALATKSTASATLATLSNTPSSSMLSPAPIGKTDGIDKAQPASKHVKHREVEAEIHRLREVQAMLTDDDDLEIKTELDNSNGTKDMLSAVNEKKTASAIENLKRAQVMLADDTDMPDNEASITTPAMDLVLEASKLSNKVDFAKAMFAEDELDEDGSDEEEVTTIEDVAAEKASKAAIDSDSDSDSSADSVEDSADKAYTKMLRSEMTADGTYWQNIPDNDG